MTARGQSRRFGRKQRMSASGPISGNVLVQSILRIRARSGHFGLCQNATRTSAICQAVGSAAGWSAPPATLPNHSDSAERPADNVPDQCWPVARSSATHRNRCHNRKRSKHRQPVTERVTWLYWNGTVGKGKVPWFASLSLTLEQGHELVLPL